MSEVVERDPLLPPEVYDWIGVPLPRVTSFDPISASDVRRYVLATGDENPLWLSDEYAQRFGYRARLVPPMFPLLLPWRLHPDWDGAAPHGLWADIPAPPEYGQQRNGGSTTEWLRPVYVGDTLSLGRRLVEISTKVGRSGKGIYITSENEYLNDDDVVVIREHQTTVLLPSPAPGS